MDDFPEQISEPTVEIELPHMVFVRRERQRKYEPGLLLGKTWYIIQNIGVDAIRDHNSNFDIGSAASGKRLDGGFTFQEARRIALAMEDSGIDETTEDTDIHEIVEAIIASALMDHYVYPVDKYIHLIE